MLEGQDLQIAMGDEEKKPIDTAVHQIKIDGKIVYIAVDFLLMKMRKYKSVYKPLQKLS